MGLIAASNSQQFQVQRHQYLNGRSLKNNGKSRGERETTSKSTIVVSHAAPHFRWPSRALAWGRQAPQARRTSGKAARAAGKPKEPGTWGERRPRGCVVWGRPWAGLVGRSPPHKGARPGPASPGPCPQGLRHPGASEARPEARGEGGWWCWAQVRRQHHQHNRGQSKVSAQSEQQVSSLCLGGVSGCPRCLLA